MDEIRKFRIAFLTQAADLLPEGVVKEYAANGKRNTFVYIKEYNGKNEIRKHRYRTTSKKGRELLELISMREQYEEKLKKLMGMPEIKYGRLDLTSIKENDKVWDELKRSEDSNKKYKKPKNASVFKGISFRSKSEMTIAMVLDELDLEYAYEPTVKIGGKVFNPDFAVYFREAGKIFFIEHYGMMGRIGYRKDSFIKFSYYIENNFRIGRDMLFFFETEDSGIAPDVFKQQIMALMNVAINEITAKRLPARADSLLSSINCLR